MNRGNTCYTRFPLNSYCEAVICHLFGREIVIWDIGVTVKTQRKDRATVTLGFSLNDGSHTAFLPYPCEVFQNINYHNIHLSLELSYTTIG